MFINIATLLILLLNNTPEKNRTNFIKSNIQKYHTDKSIKSCYDINKPSTYIEIIANVKYIIDFKCSLEENYFSNKSLLRYFGLLSVLRNDQNRKYNIAINSTDFGDISKSEKIGDFNFPGITFSAQVTRAKTGTTHSSATFLFRSSGIKFNDVEKIFGKSWTLNNIRRLHGPPLPATELHGNDRIIYVTEDKSVKKVIGMEFDRDGILSNINFSEEKK